MNTHFNTARKRSPHPLVQFVVGFLLTAVAFRSCYGPEIDRAKPVVPPSVSVVAPPDPAPDYTDEIRRYNAEVAEALNGHLHRISDLETAFEAGLRERGPSRFDAARSAIPGIRESFNGFGVMSGVVKDGAMDKVLGGDRLENRFNAALDGPFIQPCARAGASLIADFETFNARLEAETEAFRSQIGAAHGRLPEAVRADFPLETLQWNMDRAYAALRRMPLDAGLVAGAAAIEAATIRCTSAAAKRLALRFGAKAIGKGAAAVGVSAADGPAPFLDVIGVGFAAWTVWDIYDLMDVLPREIGKSLKDAVDQMQTQTISTVQNAARQAYRAHTEAARILARSVCAEGSGTTVASL